MIRVIARPSIMTCPWHEQGAAAPTEGQGENDAEIYPCDDCGKLRSKNQGGTIFTVCDACWDKHHRRSKPTEGQEVTK